MIALSKYEMSIKKPETSPINFPIWPHKGAPFFLKSHNNKISEGKTSLSFQIMDSELDAIISRDDPWKINCMVIISIIVWF